MISASVMSGYTSTFGLISNLEEISINIYVLVDERSVSVMGTGIPEARYLSVGELRSDRILSIKKHVLAIGR